MRNDLAELVFILDKSGSMAGLESDTIGGFNSLLAKQKNEPGEAYVTTILFSDNCSVLHDRINIKGVAPINENDYSVGGCTALLDAIGMTIEKVANTQKHTTEQERSGKVMIVITTDGLENASRIYPIDKVKKLVEYQTSQYNWEFIFLGANMDAIDTAAQIGIVRERAASFRSDIIGTQMNYLTLNEVCCGFRRGDKIDKNWKADIEQDYLHRDGE